ncbi:MAG TPA: hypothetical protein VM118_05575, partial [Acidobacteriota bacterium]|nr:hypothetical protein [Acidobacteriota bacterium]
MASTSPIRRRILKWIGLVLGSLAVLILLVLVFLSLPPGERLLRSFAESQLEATLGQPVSIADLETNLLSRLELTDLRVHGQNGAFSPSVVHIHHLALRYNLWGLFRRELRLTAIVVDSVTIALERNTASQSNLTLIDSLDVILADTTALPITILLDNLSLTRLNCDLRDDQLGWQAEVRGAEMQLNGRADGSYKYRLDIPQTAAIYDSIPVNLTSFVCAGLWNEDRLAVDTLGLMLDGLALAGRAATTFSDSSISAEITVTGWPEALIRAAAPRYELPTVTAEEPLKCLIQAQGTTARPHVQLRATTPALRYNELQFGSGHLALTFADDTLTIDSAVVGLGRGTIAAQGRMAADSTLWSDVNVRLAALDIRQLLTLASDQPPSISGILQGQASVSGPVTDMSALRLDARLRTRNLKYEDRSAPDLSAHASLIGGIADIEVTGGGVALHASGQFHEDQIAGDFRIEIPDLGTVARAANVPQVAGTIAASGTVSGTQAAPVVTATASGQSIRYRNWPLDSLSARLRYEAESLYVEDAVFGGAWESTDSAHALFDLPLLTGALNYRGSASGPVASLDGKVKLELRDVGTSDGPLFSGRTIFGIHGGRTASLKSRLTLDSLSLALEGQADLIDSAASLTLLINELSDPRQSDSETGTAALPGTAIAEFAARANGIGSDHLTVLLDGHIDDIGTVLRQWSDTLSATGRVALTASASGNLDDPHVELEMAARAAQYDVWYLDSLFAHIAMDRETLRCDSLTAFTAAGHTVVSADIPIQRDTATLYALATSLPGCGHIQIPDLDLTLFRPLLPDSADIAGTMAADLRWEGPLNAPAISGWASLVNARFAASPHAPPVEEIQGRFSFADSVVTVENLSGRLRGFPFDISGWVGVRGMQEFRGAVDCDLADLGTARAQGSMQRDTLEIAVQTQALRLAALSPFVPTMQVLKGSVDTDVRLYGTRDAPQAEGRLTVSDLSLCHPTLDSCLTDGRIALSFAGNRTQLDTLFARYGQGIVTGSGWFVRTDTSLAAA